MDSQALRNALQRRDVLAKERNNVLARADELGRLIARVDQFIRDHEAFEAGELPALEPSAASAPSLAATQRSSPKNSKKEAVAKAARELIEDAGIPLERVVLLHRLRENGLVIEGTAPETVLSTMLWRTREQFGVIHLRNIGYWLKERPWPDGHYEPELDRLMGVEDDAPDGAGDAEDE